MSAKKFINTFFMLLEWSVYLGLFFFSLKFTWGVYEKFHSKATVIRQYEEKITLRPTITFCFTTDMIWNHWSDFNISYRIVGQGSVICYFSPFTTYSTA